MMHGTEPRLRASVVTVVCSKCTRSEQFQVGRGVDGRDEIEAARKSIAKAGWIRRVEAGGAERTVCPLCPQTRAEMAGRA